MSEVQREDERAVEPAMAAPAPAAVAPAAFASAVGNRGVARIAAGRAEDRAALLRRSGRTLARWPALGVIADPLLPLQIAAAAQTASTGPASQPAAAPTQSRDEVVSTAILTVLNAYEHMTVVIPPTMPPAPGRRGAAAAAAPAAPAAQTGGINTVTFSTPYWINRSHGDTGGSGGAHTLTAPGVQAWFSSLPGEVKVGKGTPAEIEDAMQDAVDRGLLNGHWPPTTADLQRFMGEVGLGVDCSGFVYHALMAADLGLTAAHMPGLVNAQTTSATNTSSQEVGHTGGTRVTNPADLRPGDIIQLAPTATRTVGHVRIITSVRPGTTYPGSTTQYVEYDTAESTTRVGSGPQLSTWRIPQAGPMDVGHLQVNVGGTWSNEPSGRPTTYYRRLAVPAPAAAPAAPATAAPAQAVTRMPAERALARKPAAQRSVARTRPPLPPPRSGGWNESDRTIGHTWRLQITGLTQGLSSENRHAATAESAEHRAVAIVPNTISASNLEVLVHFHGNNLGERERLTAGAMERGTVRDVEGDLIPQQIEASGRNMIAILPQGTTDSGSLATKFGISNLATYITEVLGKVVTQVNALDPAKNLTAPLTARRIDISGHSGGGPAAVGAASTVQIDQQSSDAQWAAAPPLLLFDAINGTGELAIMVNLMLRWLNEDKRRLLAHPEPERAGLLAQRGLRMRSTYTSGVYWACNTKRDPRTYQYPPHPPVTVPAADSLEAKRDAWFDNAANRAALGSLWQTLKDQYVIEHRAGAHDFTVGMGSARPLSDPRTAVSGVTLQPDARRGDAPAHTNEAPTDSHGNLYDALRSLSPVTGLPATPAPTSTPAPATTGENESSGDTRLASLDPSLDEEFYDDPRADWRGGRGLLRQQAPPARQPPGSSGTHDGTRYVVYQDEVRSGGTKAWRNNNPGNIVGGNWANNHGAIGTAFGMAVFPDEATGAAAIPALLQTARYQAMTIRGAISTYAPPSENNTEDYIRNVVRGAGVPDTTLLSALTNDQLMLIVAVIRRVEGWRAGDTFTRSGPPWVQTLLGAAPAAPPAPAAAPPTGPYLDAGTPTGIPTDDGFVSGDTAIA